jgi:hypothetical protein
LEPNTKAEFTPPTRSDRVFTRARSVAAEVSRGRCPLQRVPHPEAAIPVSAKPSRSALRISAMGRQRRFRPATGAPPVAAFDWSVPPATREEGCVATKNIWDPASALECPYNRVDGREGGQAATSLHRGRRLAGARLRRSMGSLARSRYARRDFVLHDHRLGRQRLDGALSRPHAGATAYIEDAGLTDDPKGPLFRTIGRGTGLLTRTPCPRPTPTR